MGKFNREIGKLLETTTKSLCVNERPFRWYKYKVQTEVKENGVLYRDPIEGTLSFVRASLSPEDPWCPSRLARSEWERTPDTLWVVLNSRIISLYVRDAPTESIVSRYPEN